MTKRRSLTRNQRIRIFDAHGGRCHMCGAKIQVGDKWEVSHVTPLAMGGADDEANMAPAHYRCHRDHTAKVDVPWIAKTIRQRAAHIGAKPKAKRPMPGSRQSPWKRRLDGTIERRHAND